MWQVTGHDLKITEGDYGLQLPVTISGTTFTENDAVVFILKDKLNGSQILSKTFTNIVKNTVNLELTETESALLPVGTYAYSLDWYQDGAFMCNIIPCAAFKVGEKV